MIQRMSDQHKIKFLDNETSSEKVVKSEATPEKTLNQIAEEQKSKKLSNKDDGFMTTQHISSATTGNISDEGGPSKYIKGNSSNTIWDANRNSKASQEIDNKTKTIQEKAHISSNKREAEQKRMDNLVDTLKSTIQGKASSVSPAGTLSGTNYKVQNNNMSIFDDKDFMRVKEKTGGEKVSEDVQKKKGQEDESWRGGGKSLTSKEVTQKLMESLFDKSE